jgi:hypothetical protein
MRETMGSGLEGGVDGRKVCVGEKQALGRSRGGFSTKIHLRTNAKGNPLAFEVTSGEAHEVKGYEALMKLHDADPDRLLGDKGSTSRRRRRAKTDRIDGEALVRALLAYKRGEPRVCAMVGAPTPEDEDRRRVFAVSARR